MRPGRGTSTTLVVDAFPLDGAPSEPGRSVPPPSGPAHLLAGLRFALGRPRVLIVLCAWSWLLALAPALVVSASAERHLAHAMETADEGPADLLGETPTWMFREWERAGGAELESAAAALLPLLLLASLAGLLVSAGWMHAAVHGRGRHGLLAFLGGGGRLWFAFLRTWLLGLPLFALWTWLCWGPAGDAAAALWLPPDGDPELASSETLARWVTGGREILYFAGLLGLELVLDLARATLAARERSSALLALARGAREAMLRPLGVLSLVGAGFGVELLWIGTLRLVADSAGLGAVALGLLLPFGRVACRGARLAALATFVAQSAAARAERRSLRAPAGMPDEYAAL